MSVSVSSLNLKSAYTIAYDVNLSTNNLTKSVTSPRQDQMDVLDIAAVLSTVTRQLSDVPLKMAAITASQSEACLPLIGQILERCRQLVTVYQHNEEASLTFSSTSSVTSSSSSPPQANKTLINKLTSFIARAAPSGVFSRRKAKRRRAKQLRNCVHPELFSAWYYASQLFSPSQSLSSSNTTPLPRPTVSLKDVNAFALRNVPKPSTCNVHGCSPDHAFYKTSFKRCAPFGTMYGYRTNYGVVPVPEEPIYGHVWDHTAGDWMLSATLVKKQEVFIKQRRISRASPRRVERGTRYSTDQLC